MARPLPPTVNRRRKGSQTLRMRRADFVVVVAVVAVVVLLLPLAAKFFVSRYIIAFSVVVVVLFYVSFLAASVACAHLARVVRFLMLLRQAALIFIYEELPLRSRWPVKSEIVCRLISRARAPYEI